MNKWKILYTKDALKDREIAFQAGYKNKVLKLLKISEEDPYNNYPPYEKLIGDMTGAYSRRINHQHRLVYSVYKEYRTIKIISMWLHYE